MKFLFYNPEGMKAIIDLKRGLFSSRHPDSNPADGSKK